MNLLEIICNIVNEILGNLSTAVPQLAPLWDAIQAEVDEICD
jgi:hypothetical protein